MRFSQSVTSLFVFAGLCSALPMPMMKRQDAIASTVGAVVSDAGSLVNDTGLGAVLKRDDPASNVLTAVEGLIGGGASKRQLTQVGDALNDLGLGGVVSAVDSITKRQDPIVSTVDGVVTAVEGTVAGVVSRQLTQVGDALNDLGLGGVVSAVDSITKRQDPIAETVGGVVTTVEDTVNAAVARQLTQVGDALNDLGLGGVVSAVDSITKRDDAPAAPLVEVNLGSLGTDLSQIAARDDEYC